MRNILIKLIHTEMQVNKNCFLLTGDLGFGALDKLFEDFPRQVFNAGISEQAMVSIATGIGAQGGKCFTYSIANFASLRCLEQIRSSAVYHDVDLNIISVGEGFTYGAQGYTHHAIDEFSCLRAVGSNLIATPSCEAEVISCFERSKHTVGVKYFRIGNVTHNYPTKKINAYFNHVIGTGKSVIITCGALVTAYADYIAENRLENDVKLVSMPIYSPDIDCIEFDFLLGADKVIFVQEHVLCGGLYEATNRFINQKIPIFNYSIDPERVRHEIGSQEYLQKLSGIDPCRVITEQLTCN